MNLSLRIKYKHVNDIKAENSKMNELKFVLNLKTTLNKVVNKAGEYLGSKIADSEKILNINQTEKSVVKIEH